MNSTHSGGHETKADAIRFYRMNVVNNAFRKRFRRTEKAMIAKHVKLAHELAVLNDELKDAKVLIE